MNKVNDEMEWRLIIKVMKKMGFHDSFCGLIMQCLTSVSYSIFLNGSKFRRFVPTKGLRQRDPLSMFMALLK